MPCHMPSISYVMGNRLQSSESLSVQLLELLFEADAAGGWKLTDLTLDAIAEIDPYSKDILQCLRNQESTNMAHLQDNLLRRRLALIALDEREGLGSNHQHRSVEWVLRLTDLQLTAEEAQRLSDNNQNKTLRCPRRLLGHTGQVYELGADYSQGRPDAKLSVRHSLKNISIQDCAPQQAGLLSMFHWQR